MIAADTGLTAAQPAVIATKPASAPLSDIPASGLPRSIHAVTIAAIAPAAAARFVVTAIPEISAASAPIWLPGLNPNQPSHKIKTPSAARGRLCPAIGLGFPSPSYLPRRGPKTMAPVNASQPPVEWTTVEPAKSDIPRLDNQPAPQIQCPTTG